MDNITNLLNNPILLFAVIFIFIIRYLDKILLIIPNSQKKLVRLQLSKQSLDKKDKSLKHFLKEEIRKTNFYCASGLILNNKNLELIRFYFKHSKSVAWSELKQIRNLISKSEYFVPVFHGKQKFIVYLKTTLWAILSLYGMFELGKIFYKILNMTISNNYLEVISNPLFIFVFSYVMFISWFEKISILKKYDNLFLIKSN